MEFKAIYAFSGDPITFGHIDIIKRGLKSFGSLLIAIGDNPNKKYLFSKFERIELIKNSLRGLEGIEVVPFEGMLTDFAYEKKIGIILRGIRNATDFDYESLLFQLGQTQKQGLDFHFLLARPEMSHISSGSTKALQLEQGDISKYVPLQVKVALEQKVSSQIFLGVTGEIAAGKSFLSSKIESSLRALGIPCHHIDLDHLAYEIFENSSEPIYEQIRQRLVEAFGRKILSTNGFVDRKEVGKLIFESKESLRIVNQIMLEPMALKLKRAIYGKKGLIILNSALLIEAKWNHYCNNRMVLVTSPLDVRLKRLRERGWQEAQIQQRVNAQFDSNVKKSQLEEFISTDGFGKIWEFSNSENNFESLFENLKQQLFADLKLEDLNGQIS